MTVQEINNNLEIKKINKLKFGNESTYVLSSGYAFYHKDLGYLSFKVDNSNKGTIYKVAAPYKPSGGKKALQFILDGGGFSDFDSVEWIKPIQ